MSQDTYRLFDLDKVAAQLSRFTVNVHDYKMLSPTVARVILSYTGTVPTQEQMRQEIAALFDNNASAVAGSFRQLTTAGDVKSAVGFVKMSREVRPFGDEEVKAAADTHKVMASNLLMNKADGSMWEIKSGAMGKYLAKQTGDDLRELIHLAHASVGGLPRFSSIASLASMTQPKEFAAYVDLNAEEVLHGFVIESSADKIKILAKETDEVVEVAADQLVQVQDLEGEEKAAITASPEMQNFSQDAAGMVAYYRLAYRYSPDYIQKIIDIIGQHSFA
jgi:hypothetical protein